MILVPSSGSHNVEGNYLSNGAMVGDVKRHMLNVTRSLEGLAKGSLMSLRNAELLRFWAVSRHVLPCSVEKPVDVVRMQSGPFCEG